MRKAALELAIAMATCSCEYSQSRIDQIHAERLKVAGEIKQIKRQLPEIDQQRKRLANLRREIARLEKEPAR